MDLKLLSTTKAVFTCFALYSLSPYTIYKESAILVYNTLILPLFDHCDTAWSSILQQDMDRIQRLKNRSAWIITRCLRLSESIGRLRWPALVSRCSYHNAKLVFLCLQSLVPSYFFYHILHDF